MLQAVLQLNIPSVLVIKYFNAVWFSDQILIRISFIKLFLYHSALFGCKFVSCTRLKPCCTRVDLRCTRVELSCTHVEPSCTRVELGCTRVGLSSTRLESVAHVLNSFVHVLNSVAHVLNSVVQVLNSVAHVLQLVAHVMNLVTMPSCSNIVMHNYILNTAEYGTSSCLTCPAISS